MSPYASTYYRVVPAANLSKKFDGPVSMVKVLAGAFPGARIHWTAPTSQSYTGQESELLVNGECYIAPGGKAERFWITAPAAIPTAAGELFLRAFDCSSPVVVLNATADRGGEAHMVGRGNDPLIEVAEGAIALYTDARVDGSGLEETAYEIPLSRGYIGGSLSAAGAAAQELHVWLEARVNPTSNTYWAELARWELTALDKNSRYGCCFEVGGTATFRTTATYIRNGPTILTWPAFGMRLRVQAITGDFTDVEWNLHERSL